MPSGRTHDRITLWSLPFVAGVTFSLTWSGDLTLIVSAGFLFGGLMFGPDLDIYSRQFQRWGPLRWIWIPYQTSLRHRAFLSHGPIIGTMVRSLYLFTWIAVLAGLGLFMIRQFWDLGWTWQLMREWALASLQQHYAAAIALFVGLELGAMSHSISDWTGSAYKRVKNRGLSALLPAKTNKRKRKSTPRKSRSSRSPASKSKIKKS